ncbi:hypothetical protein J1N35_044270 [Gossypium stocksii]|uniref:Uncharacterized protein n=1 Tax=Gossypium stocksii TaxID=47602 RepID=A0A9D3U8Q8_9ROSI|nr:hypothetical protein J1N35_044270 [Gossypium stocksii]
MGDPTVQLTIAGMLPCKPTLVGKVSKKMGLPSHTTENGGFSAVPSQRALLQTGGQA